MQYPSSTYTYDTGGNHGESIYEFHASTPGAYTIEVSTVGEPGLRSGDQIAIGRKLFDGGRIAGILGSLALGGVSFLVGLIVLIVTIVRRSRARRRPTYAPYQPPYGGGPYGGAPPGTGRMGPTRRPARARLAAPDERAAELVAAARVVAVARTWHDAASAGRAAATDARLLSVAGARRASALGLRAGRRAAPTLGAAAAHPVVALPRRPVPWLALVGFGLLLAGIVGAIGWVGAFSPYGFVRFSLWRADRTIMINRPGDYLVFEEGAGATDSDLPPRLAITVMDDGGASVPVEQLIDPGTRAAPYAYHVPPNEGRGIARFTASRSGRYFLQVEPLAAQGIDPSDYRPDPPASLAVGRELDIAWLRTPLGLLALGGVPFAAGVVVLVIARRRRQGEHGAKPPVRPPELVR